MLSPSSVAPAPKRTAAHRLVLVFANRALALRLRSILADLRSLDLRRVSDTVYVANCQFSVKTSPMDVRRALRYAGVDGSVCDAVQILAPEPRILDLWLAADGPCQLVGEPECKLNKGRASHCV